MRALSLAVLKVLRLDEVDAGACPLLGERICVIDVHVDGSTAHPLEIDAGPCEMNRQLVAVSKRIPLVVMRGTEAQLLVVGHRPRHIRDHEDRLDTDDASHSEIIGTSPTSVETRIGRRGTFPSARPGLGSIPGRRRKPLRSTRARQRLFRNGDGLRLSLVEPEGRIDVGHQCRVRDHP